MSRYEIRTAPGWHGRPTDPIEFETDDEREAALWAGCRADISMPGNCNRHSRYAVDAETGAEVDRIESFWCESCDKLVEWGESGPIGTRGGAVLECPGAIDKHLVTWVCEACAAAMEGDGDAE